MDAIPLTPIGKIFKPALRAQAIEWAITSVAEKVGIQAHVTVNDDLSASIQVPPNDRSRLKSALTGMPINLTFAETPNAEE